MQVVAVEVEAMEASVVHVGAVEAEGTLRTWQDNWPALLRQVRRLGIAP